MLEKDVPDIKNQYTLSDVEIGEAATVILFKDQRLVNNRLASLGFTPGVDVKMLQNSGRGPLIVIVRGTRVALGRSEACHIIVKRA